MTRTERYRATFAILRILIITVAAIAAVTLPQHTGPSHIALMPCETSATVTVATC